MISRRKAIKSLGITALSLPAFSGNTKAASSTAILSLPSPNDPSFWQGVRDQYMLAKDKVFFNPGTIGVMPRVVVDRVTKHMNYMATNVADWAYKDDNAERFITGYQHLLFIRTKVAKLLNCDAKEIALTDNTTHAMSYIAQGLELKPGDEIITSNQEHGGGISSWMVREKRDGAKVKIIELPKPIHSKEEVIDLIVKSFTPKTKVLMLSHIISGSGAILPAREICAEAKRRGIFTVLDGAQTTGHIKVDLSDIDCDAYVGCFHKWMGAPAGTGYMYVKPEYIKNIWTTVASYRWDNHDDEGFRFTQRGTGNFSMIEGLDAALDFYFQIGPERAYERIKFLGDRLRAGLRKINKVKIYSPDDNAMCSGITVYNIDGYTGTKLQDAFWEKARMRPRASGDVFGVRHCTHIFNSPEEIDQVLTIVKQLAS
jgi:selenocysteine lyase/cysteine desulfurase